MNNINVTLLCILLGNNIYCLKVDYNEVKMKICSLKQSLSSTTKLLSEKYSICPKESPKEEDKEDQQRQIPHI